MSAGVEQTCHGLGASIHHRRFPDCAVRNESPDFRVCRAESPLMSNDEFCAIPFAGFNHVVGAAHRRSHRFFADDALDACISRRNGDFSANPCHVGMLTISRSIFANISL